MTPASSVESSSLPPDPAPVSTPTPEPHALGETIAALAARIHAADLQLLVMLREFDAREGWNTGFLSCAHWLHWRTGFDLGAAARRCASPARWRRCRSVSAEMQRGRSVLRQGAGNHPRRDARERAGAARPGACRHVGAGRAIRPRVARVDRVEAARQADARHLSRELSTWVDDDGMVVIRGRLTPEAGAVVQRALQAASDRLFREAAGCGSRLGCSPTR